MDGLFTSTDKIFKKSPFGDRGNFLINKDLCNAFLVFVLQFCSFHS